MRSALWAERGRYGEVCCSWVAFSCACDGGFVCYMLSVLLALTVFVFLQVGSRGTGGRGPSCLGSGLPVGSLR